MISGLISAILTSSRLLKQLNRGMNETKKKKTKNENHHQPTNLSLIFALHRWFVHMCMRTYINIMCVWNSKDIIFLLIHFLIAFKWYAFAEKLFRFITCIPTITATSNHNDIYPDWMTEIGIKRGKKSVLQSGNHRLTKKKEKNNNNSHPLHYT